MAISKGNIVDINISNTTIHRSFISVSLGEGDKKGDKIGVRLFDNQQPVNLLSATCVGYFIRPDDITLVISGEVNGNTAFVELPEAAYAKEGQFTLSIKVSGTGYANTVRIVDGTIVNTTTGTIYDPSSQVPSIEQYEQDIATAQVIADDINAIHMSRELITGTRYKIIVTKDE